MDLQSRIEESPPYQVIESPEFADQFALLVTDARIRDLLQWEFFNVLPTDPEKFPQVPNSKLRAVTIGMPGLTLFFTIENRVITLLEIHPL